MQASLPNEITAEFTFEDLFSSLNANFWTSSVDKGHFNDLSPSDTTPDSKIGDFTSSDAASRESGFSYETSVSLAVFSLYNSKAFASTNLALTSSLMSANLGTNDSVIPSNFKMWAPESSITTSDTSPTLLIANKATSSWDDNEPFSNKPNEPWSFSKSLSSEYLEPTSSKLLPDFNSAKASFAFFA